LRFAPKGIGSWTIEGRGGSGADAAGLVGGGIGAGSVAGGLIEAVVALVVVATDVTAEGCGAVAGVALPPHAERHNTSAVKATLPARWRRCTCRE
jgi:hypothetical protein